MIERFIGFCARKPFADMCEFERLQWGFLLSWALVFNMLPAGLLVAHFAGWLR